MPLQVVVIVVDSGKEYRFRFDDQGAAWDCYAAAIQAGFEARAQTVRTRDAVPVPA